MQGKKQPRLVEPKVQHAMKRIVDYIGYEEYKHWLGSGGERDHIWHSFRTVAEWLDHDVTGNNNQVHPNDGL
jgi:hypothetical protein